MENVAGEPCSPTFSKQIFLLFNYGGLKLGHFDVVLIFFFISGVFKAVYSS